MELVLAPHEKEVAELGEPVTGLLAELREILTPLPSRWGMEARVRALTAPSDSAVLAALGDREREVFERLSTELAVGGLGLADIEDLADAVVEAQAVLEELSPAEDEDEDEWDGDLDADEGE